MFLFKCHPVKITQTTCYFLCIILSHVLLCDTFQYEPGFTISYNQKKSGLSVKQSFLLTRPAKKKNSAENTSGYLYTTNMNARESKAPPPTHPSTPEPLLFGATFRAPAHLFFQKVIEYSKQRSCIECYAIFIHAFIDVIFGFLSISEVPY